MVERRSHVPARRHRLSTKTALKTAGVDWSSHISVMAEFAIPFGRLVAERLFKRCGRDFVADEGVRFNFERLHSRWETTCS